MFRPWLSTLMLAILVVISGIARSDGSANVESLSDGTQATPITGRSIGYGYGYGDRRSSGYGNDYGHGGEHTYGYGAGYGGKQGYRQDHYRDQNKVVPISIPFVDRNGCKAPGDIVCRAAKPLCTYNLCMLSDENSNLWKKPSLTVFGVACPATTGVLTEFCNNNEDLLRAIGFITSNYKSQATHPKKYVSSLNPCLLVRGNAICDGAL